MISGVWTISRFMFHLLNRTCGGFLGNLLRGKSKAAEGQILAILQLMGPRFAMICWVAGPRFSLGQQKAYSRLTGWWFQTFFIFHNTCIIWDNLSHWLIFFKMVKTTNQLNIMPKNASVFSKITGRGAIECQSSGSTVYQWGSSWILHFQPLRYCNISDYSTY
jgi:hypothetical protein